MGRKKETRETSESQQLLMAAALDVLGTKGMDGATARAIANKAGVNQSLIFYHFGTVTQLLIAAVNSQSNERLGVYKEALSRAQTVDDLLKITFEIFEEDRHGPSYVVLSQIVAGAQSNPELSQALEPLFAQFIQLTKESLTRVVGDLELPGEITYDDIAIGIISLFLGVRLIGSVSKYDENVDSLLSKVQNASPMINMFLTMLSKPKS